MRARAGSDQQHSASPRVLAQELPHLRPAKKDERPAPRRFSDEQVLRSLRAAHWIGNARGSL